MDHMGPSLKDLFNLFNHKFGHLKTICLLTDQLVCLMQFVWLWHWFSANFGITSPCTPHILSTFTLRTSFIGISNQIPLLWELAKMATKSMSLISVSWRSSWTWRSTFISCTGRTKSWPEQHVTLPLTPIWVSSKPVMMILNLSPTIVLPLWCLPMARTQGCYQQAEIWSHHGEEDDRPYWSLLPEFPQ